VEGAGDNAEGKAKGKSQGKKPRGNESIRKSRWKKPLDLAVGIGCWLSMAFMFEP
jgi:hypothetical protein